MQQQQFLSMRLFIAILSQTPNTKVEIGCRFRATSCVTVAPQVILIADFRFVTCLAPSKSRRRRRKCYYKRLVADPIYWSVCAPLPWIAVSWLANEDSQVDYFRNY